MIRDFMGMPLKRCAVEALTWLLGVSLQCLLIADARAQGSAAADREALEALYHATGGPDWIDRANWLSAAPLGEWFGVATDADGRVTSLALPGNGLSGKVPPELGRLASLQRLDLGGRLDPISQQWVYNELSDTIPPELADLANLQWLDLRDNRLSGAVPRELSHLTNLQGLSMWGNELSGEIPPELAALANLQSLELGNNRLLGEIPPELGGLTNLRWLGLGGNQLSGAIPPQLGGLMNLLSLSLGSNQLSGAIPPELAALANLQRLYLGGNPLSGKIPGDLMQLSELTTLDLSDTGVCVPTGDDIQAWLATIADFHSSGLACDGSLRVSFSAPRYAVREGGSVEVRVRLIDQTNGPALSATIPLTVTPGGGATEEDYTGAPDRVTITAPAATATFVVTAVEDPHYDQAETVTLGFRRPLPSGVTSGSPDTAVVTIHDPGSVVVDRGALEAIYHATNGPEWRNRANWLSAKPVGEWFGVGTDSDGRVTSLALIRNGLSGAIPPELADLANLQELYLRGNELSGVIPPELTALTNLLLLDLGANGLSGTIPAELGGLTQLHRLNLWSNRLSGAIPAELGGLTQLHRLNLRSNRLSGAIPRGLAGLANLQELDLGVNGLSGAIPAELGGLTQLHHLDLGGNRLSGAIPPGLADLTNLQVLVLWGNELSGKIPRGLGALANLRVLDLLGNELSGPIPLELGALANLQELYLGGNELSGEIPRGLGSLADLRVLDLGANELSGEIPPGLGALAGLRVLILMANELSGEIPPELGGLAELFLLDLLGNELSGEIPPGLGGLTNLSLLRIGFNPNLSGVIPRQFLRLKLPILNLMATAVCVPSDEEFQEWLATIERFTPSGAVCGRLPEEMTSIDVAVFYTPAARREAGGTREIEAEIDLMVTETNRAYENGGVHQRIVLAAAEEVPYEAENAGGFWTLGRLADEGDGYMDEVHAIRDRVGADLVHLIAKVTDVGGIALLGEAFALTCAGCGADVFAHELGHNMGLSHDRYIDRGFLPYSHGYVNQRAFEDGAPESAHWFTIMAYPTQCERANVDYHCGGIMRFSNPNQSYLGDPLGVPGESRTSAVNGPADAVRTLNITRHSVATFRGRSQDTISRARSGGKQAARPRRAAGVRSGGLFTAVSKPKQGGGESDPKALRRREAAVDIGQLAQVSADRPTALPLNLFDDVMLTGVIMKRTPTSSGGYALTGPLFGVAGGTVALVVNGDVVAGTVRLPGATYRIRPAGAGRHAIVQVDPSQSSWRCGTEPLTR